MSNLFSQRPSQSRGKFHAHIGLTGHGMEVLALEGYGFISDNDQWEEWGEPANLNDGHALHIIVIGDDPQALGRSLVRNIGHVLIAMEREQQRDVIVCVTPADDWSEPVYEIVRVS